jgi:hypothetical protein
LWRKKYDFVYIFGQSHFIMSQFIVEKESVAYSRAKHVEQLQSNSISVQERYWIFYSAAYYFSNAFVVGSMAWNSNMSIFMSWVQVKELLYIYTLHRLRIIFSGRFILFLLQQTHHVDQTPRPKGSDSCVCKNSPKAYTFFFSFLFLSLEIGFINHSEYYYFFVK